MSPLSIYVAGSFKHKHGVRLLGVALAGLGCRILDWTEKAVPPQGLTPAERRIWMDTDRDGGQVYAFCRDACQSADVVIYYGASGQDAGVEVGMAAAANVPVLGIRGPLEGPGLMLHGAVSVWVDSVEEVLDLVGRVLALMTRHASGQGAESSIGMAAAIAAEPNQAVRRLCAGFLRKISTD